MVRDLLLYPSPMYPYTSAGWLRRQTSLGGPIERVGKFSDKVITNPYKNAFSKCCSTADFTHRNYRRPWRSFDPPIGLPNDRAYFPILQYPHTSKKRLTKSFFTARPIEKTLALFKITAFLHGIFMVFWFRTSMLKLTLCHLFSLQTDSHFQYRPTPLH